MTKTVIRFFKRLTCKHSYTITSERRNICTHEDMYELTCIKMWKNYVNKPSRSKLY